MHHTHQQQQQHPQLGAPSYGPPPPAIATAAAAAGPASAGHQSFALPPSPALGAGAALLAGRALQHAPSLEGDVPDPPPTLWEFFYAEATPHEKYPTADVLWRQTERDRVYNFLLYVPYQLERIMIFGTLLCFYSFLGALTVLPLRCLRALLRLLARPLERGGRGGRAPPPLLPGAQLYDLLCALLLLGAVLVLAQIRPGVIYYWMKDITSEFLKIQVLFTALEICDKILSNFGVDVLEALSSTCTLYTQSRIGLLQLGSDLLVALLLITAHGSVLMCQAMVFAVTMNSKRNALLALMIATNFVELKGQVYKRTDTNKLWTLACQDIVERFQLLLVLGFVVVEDISNSGTWWPSPATLLECGRIFLWEVVIDISKHAVLGKFNDIRPGIYREYMRDLCSDSMDKHSHNVHKLLGFCPLGPAALSLRMVHTLFTLKCEGRPDWQLRSLVLLLLWLGACMTQMVLGFSLKWLAYCYVHRQAMQPGGKALPRAINASPAGQHKVLQGAAAAAAAAASGPKPAPGVSPLGAPAATAGVAAAPAAAAAATGGGGGINGVINAPPGAVPLPSGGGAAGAAAVPAAAVASATLPSLATTSWHGRLYAATGVGPLLGYSPSQSPTPASGAMALPMPGGAFGSSSSAAAAGAGSSSATAATGGCSTSRGMLLTHGEEGEKDALSVAAAAAAAAQPGHHSDDGICPGGGSPVSSSGSFISCQTAGSAAAAMLAAAAAAGGGGSSSGSTSGPAPPGMNGSIHTSSDADADARGISGLSPAAAAPNIGLLSYSWSAGMPLAQEASSRPESPFKAASQLRPFDIEHDGDEYDGVSSCGGGRGGHGRGPSGLSGVAGGGGLGAGGSPHASPQVTFGGAAAPPDAAAAAAGAAQPAVYSSSYAKVSSAGLVGRSYGKSASAGDAARAEQWQQRQQQLLLLQEHVQKQQQEQEWQQPKSRHRAKRE